MNITIIGCGAYSLAIAKRMAKNKNNKITIWTESKENALEYEKTNKIKNIYKDEIFSKNIVVTDSYEKALENTGIIFLMTSSKFVKSTLENIKEFYNKKIPVVIGTKGIDNESKKYNSILVNKILKTKNIAVIAGPSFAIDILNDAILALTVATRKRKIFIKINNVFNNTRTVLKRSYDLAGVQLSSTLKNVYAIGSGILNGLGNPESTNSIYLTKVINEMYNIIYMLEDQEITILSYAGIGDTIMTCNDTKSRNYTYGMKLTSKTKTAAKNYLSKNTVEGYEACKTMYEIIKKNRVKAKLLITIYEILYENKDCKELEKELLG